MKKKTIAALVMILMALAGCDADLDSRGGNRFDVARTSDADEIRDVDWVITYRNVRRVPNIIISCLDGIAFASTTSGESGSTGRDIERVEEFDHECEGKEYGGGGSSEFDDEE